MRLGIDASNIRAGGGQKHLVELLRAACPHEQGIDRVIVWGRDTTLRMLPNAQWLEKVHVQELEDNVFLRYKWQQTQLETLANHACDLLFSPGGTYRSSSPYVSMSQNMLVFDPQERARFGLSRALLRYIILQYIQKRSFQQAAGVLFLTEYARTTIMKNVKIEAATAVIPHGIEENFRLAPRVQKPLESYSSKTPFHLLYVSIVNLYKHQWYVSEAVASLRQQGFPIVLDLIGPAYKPALKRLKKTLSDLDPEAQFIRYHGPVPYNELRNWYHTADAFIFASSCENLPNILVEAMSSGLPIACSNKGPMPEVLKDAGVYFDPEVPSSISASLINLLTDHHLRQECAWESYERAKEFSWSRCARDTFLFFREAANHFAACRHS